MTDHDDVIVIGSGAGAGALTGQPEGSGFEVYDPEFEAVLGDDARLELVAETDAHEGPVYIPGQDALYFTTLPRPGNISAPGTPQAVIKRLALNGLSFPVDESRLSALPTDVHMPNGMTLGHDGHLVVCEQGTRGLGACAGVASERQRGRGRGCWSFPLRSQCGGRLWRSTPCRRSGLR